MARRGRPAPSASSATDRPRFPVGLGRSVVIRLIGALLIAVTPIYMLGLVIYVRGIDTLRREVAASMDARATFFMDYLEREIESVKGLEHGLVNDDDLSRLAAIPDAFDVVELYQALARLQRRLVATASSSLLIGDIRVHLRLLGSTLQMRSIDPLDPGTFATLSTGGPASVSRLLYIGDRMVLRVAFPWPEFRDSQEALFVIEIDVFPRQLSTTLDRLSRQGDEGYLLVRRTAGTTLAGSVPPDASTALEELGRTGEGGGPHLLTIAGEPSLAVVAPSEALDMSLVYYRPERELLARLRGSNLWLLVLSGLAVALVLLFTRMVYTIVYEPMHDLVDAFRKLEAGDFDVRIRHTGEREFGYLFAAFDTMTGRLNELINQSYRQTILIQKAELKRLQSQINPHFLYNTFFMLYSIAKAEGATDVAELTQRLGTYYQFVTRSTEDEVLLEREVDHARVYTDIQELRFGDRLTAKIGEIPRGRGELLVPRLILQPLIENAIEHGLKPVAGPGRVTVEFHDGPEGLCISVVDNGVGIGPAELERLRGCLEGADVDGTHTALANIHRRIRLRFGESSGLEIETLPERGVRATIRIRARAECTDS